MKLLKTLLVPAFICGKLFAQSPTFHKEVSAIIQKRCTPCHKPGEAAPFSLISYSDVSKRATFIKDVVNTGFMPPWRPDNSYVHFANDRSLSKEEINIISKWVDAGAPEGKATAKATTDKPLLAGTSYYRKPDLSLKPAKFLVKGDNLERFIVYKIPFELPDSANVEAIEFFSSDKKLIHHSNFAVHPVDTSIDINRAPEYINLTEQSRILYNQYMPFKKSMTYYGGWIPGTSFENYPEGIGWVMPKRGVILLTVHYGPGVKDVEIENGVNFFFTKEDIKRKVKVISIGSGGVGEDRIQPRFTFIPANKISRFNLRVDNRSETLSVLYLWPHMHLLGKTFKSYAVSPDYDTIPLVHIPSWDFRWQEIYRLQNLVKIPQNSTIHLECDYDNTAQNPFNPNSPPEGVYSWGDMKTNEEMMTMVIVYLPYMDGDEKKDLIFKKYEH
ncbi:MAG: cytochrome c [Chitinophagaceae bacterium]|nr:MAG: cytochrome c [Chitinophagaceae bacterium]